MSGERTKDCEITEFGCSEARHVIDLQVKRIENVDRKAIRIFRYNLLIVGLLLTGISIAFGVSEINLDAFVNIWSVVGFFLLVLSSCSAAVAYTSSSFDLGISEEVIEKIEDDHYEDKEDFVHNLRDNYKNWIAHNNRVLKFNSYLITASICSSFDAILLFVGASAVGISSLEGEPISYVSFVLSVTLLFGTNLIFWYAEWVFERVSNSIGQNNNV